MRLLAYCRGEKWAGYDPYDGLNSRLFQSLPFLHFKWARLALIQGMKRSVVNLRPLLLVPKSHNPKAIALFISALLKLRNIGLLQEGAWIDELTERLEVLRSPGVSYWCWGYNFDWQNRTTLVPKGTPNIICTTFAGHALLDVYEAFGDPRFLEEAKSAAAFVRDVLFQSNGSDEGWFNYTPLGQSQVHNANLLGAYFLARTADVSDRAELLEPAEKGAMFSIRRQYADGSWDYGEQDRPSQRWKDNFHTGFNLCALHGLALHADIEEVPGSLEKGLAYYRKHFFRSDGAPRYYHDRTYPIDIHSVAQAIITLVQLRGMDRQGLEQADRVARWAMRHLWDERGYFYYQQGRLTNRISYMRWSQAWMLLALASLLEARMAGHA